MARSPSKLGIDRGAYDPGEVGTLVPEGLGREPGLELYVATEAGLARYPLPARGALVIGRSPECAVVIDDPMVSRRHAILVVDEGLMLNDLGGPNGTTVEGKRLVRGSIQAIAPETTIVLGAATLVVRRTALVRPPAERLLTTSALFEELSRTNSTWGSVGLIKVTVDRAIQPGWVQAIIARVLAPEDRLVPLRAAETGVLRPQASGDAAMAELARRCVSALAGWQIPAHAEALIVGAGRGPSPADAVATFLGVTLPHAGGAIVLADPGMLEVHRIVTRVAPTDVTVLLLGETGVGKDVIASLIHARSRRAAQAFLRLNCATFSETLLESELFGHAKGAFTGAVSHKAGLLESADGGTVFLDEVGELPLSLQARLLRLLESREVMRVGGLKPQTVDVRFIAATNRDLQQEVARGTFRRDLFHRLDIMRVEVPPLRERKAEIGPLARHFLAEACRQHRMPALTFAAPALAALEACAWPGNIRELRNVVERAALLCQTGMLSPQDLDLPGARDGASGVAVTLELEAPDSNPDRDPDPDDDERRRVQEALLRCGGNQSRAAELLGIPRRTFVRRLARLQVPRPRALAAGPGPRGSGAPG